LPRPPPAAASAAAASAAAAAAQVCGGGLATIGNMKNERMAIGIDKGIVNSGNQAQPGKGATWCDILNGPEEDTATTVATDWQSYKSIWLSE
jgi:hypothetical protein